jgi:GxxExxY protein
MTAEYSRRGHKFGTLSHDVIGACIDVQRAMGIHCRELDYQRALELVLPKCEVTFEREVEIPIFYEGQIVTIRRVDFYIEREQEHLFLETKARGVLLPEDIEQCLIYLHNSSERLCLLVNFGQRPLVTRRLVYDLPVHSRRASS